MSNGAASVQVRRMSEADLDQVLAIAASLKEAPHWPRATYLSALDPASTPHRIALVAVDQDSSAVRGFAIASLLPPQAELESIAVASDNQRHGVGRALLGALVAKLRALAASEFLLEVRATNNRALAFYRSSGWVETGRRPRYYADPEEDAALMSLTLSEDDVKK